MLIRNQIRNQILLTLAAGVTAAISATSAIADIQPIQATGDRFSLDELVVLLKEEEPPLGSRSILCAISPGLLGDTDQIWSDRPIFIWQGSSEQLTLRPLNSEEALWSQPLSETDQIATYTGAPLQPGQSYEWELTNGGVNPYGYVFEVIGAEQRDRITRDLQALDEQLKTSGVSAEETAIARARYFAEQGLWSDALQTLQTVENPSDQLVQRQAEMTTYLCGEQ